MVYECPLKENGDESEPDKDKKFNFHKNYLSMISEPLGAMLNNSSYREIQNEELKIVTTDYNFINNSTIKAFHKVLYENNLDKFSFHKDFTIGLLVLAEQYQIESLYVLCITAIEEMLKNANYQNMSEANFMINDEDHIIDVLKAAHMLNDKPFFERAAKFAYENSGKLEKSYKWKYFVNENSDSYNEFCKFRPSRGSILIWALKNGLFKSTDSDSE